MALRLTEAQYRALAKAGSSLKPKRSRQPRAPRSISPADDLRLHCRARGLPEPVPEFKFHPTRKWKFDWAFPDLWLAVEQEGIVYPKHGGHLEGRHVSVRGFKADIEKYAEAARLGWTVIRQLPEDVRSGRTADLIADRIRRQK